MAIFRKNIVIALYPSFMDRFTNVKYDNILMNFEFEGSRAKVTVAIFRKTLSLL